MEVSTNLILFNPSYLLTSCCSSHLNKPKSSLLQFQSSLLSSFPNKVSCNNLSSSNCSLKTWSILCNACQLGKSHKLSFPSSSTTYTKPLELVVLDLWGLSPTISHNGCKYYVTFVDSYIRFTWIYFLKAKFDLYASFLHFNAQAVLQLNTRLLILQTDWGEEYRRLNSYLAQNGIIFHQTCPRTSEQNDIVERKHRHIVKTGFTLTCPS